MSTQNFFLTKDIEAKVVGEGVTRKVLAHNDDLMVCEVSFETGSIGPMHQHPHTQSTYVKSGAFEFTINGVKKIVREGDTMYKEPNVLHGCVCLEKGVLIDIFTPERKDFLA